MMAGVCGKSLITFIQYIKAINVVNIAYHYLSNSLNIVDIFSIC